MILSLFGAPAIEHGGKSHALDFERRTQLLAYLALKRAWVGRAELAALLWPEQESKLAFANLRKALHRLRSLPGAGPVETQGNALRFPVATDVQAFEQALAERRLPQALELRRGDLLEGFDDGGNEAWTGWLAFERERLRAAWSGAARSRLSEDLDPAEAVDLASRLLELDPLDEQALRLLVDWLGRAGQHARARRVHGQFVERLRQELGLAPSASLEALAGAIGASVPAPSAAAAKPDDGFVGRTVELRRIAALLGQDDCRLLCLTGPGGVGKTRLAQRVLQEIGPGFPGGATFVALDDLVSAADVGGRLARELEVALKGREDPLDQVIAALRSRQALLVLDNFEQLAGGAPALERLLAACPKVKVVVTSRARLALAGEWLFPLDGMPWPEDEDLDRIEAFDAASLFIRAARRVQPDFSPAEEAAAIVDICRQVEGLPLALELAAAWTRVLSCAAIAAELRQGMELLQAVDPARHGRHASIEVVFDQSWRLLSDLEREVLARLAALHGSFTPEAARAVGRAPLPVLASLADKSLLRRDGARLRLHPLVQQLAAARLGEGHERASALAAHAAYFHNLLAGLASACEVGERGALQTIDLEFENCRQAWQFSIAQGQAAALSRSAPALLDYFDHRARFVDGLEMMRQALASRVGRGDAALGAQLQGLVAFLESRLGRYADARQGAAAALDASRATRDPGTRFRALSVLAACAVNTGELAQARRLYRQALALAQARERAFDAASMLENLALVEKRLGHFEDCLRLSTEALAQHRRNGDSAAVALCLSNLGSLHMFLHDDAAAAVHLQEALALSERDGLVSTRAFALANLTELALRSRDAERARGYAERALEVAEASGIRALAGWLKVQLARLAAWRGDLDRAHALLGEGAGLAAELGAPSLKAAVLLGLAEVLEGHGHDAAARRVLAFAKDQPSISVPDREELRLAWERRGGPASAPAAWPALPLDELVMRLADEGDRAHAALFTLLAGPA